MYIRKAVYKAIVNKHSDYALSNAMKQGLSFCQVEEEHSVIMVIKIDYKFPLSKVKM